MAKKRTYDISNLTVGYEKTIEKQKDIAASEENESSQNSHSSFEYTPEPYYDPDKEDYKRVSLFMEFQVWERLQAICFEKGEAVNKFIVDKLRELGSDVTEESLNRYRKDKKQKHLQAWAHQRDVLRTWWQTSGLYDKIHVASYKMNRTSLTITEENGNERVYYIHRGWITDGNQKFIKVKTVESLIKTSRRI